MARVSHLINNIPAKVMLKNMDTLIPTDILKIMTEMTDVLSIVIPVAMSITMMEPWKPLSIPAVMLTNLLVTILLEEMD